MTWIETLRSARTRRTPRRARRRGPRPRRSREVGPFRLVARWLSSLDGGPSRSGPQGQGYCKFGAPAGSSPVLLGYTGQQFLGDVPASGQIDSRYISLGGGFNSSQGGIVEMVCKSEGANSLESMGGDLVVTKVGELAAD